jgi:hypothetical protein
MESKNKTIFKLKPFDNWQIGEIENWLTELSNDGWQLDEIGFLFAKFKQSEERNRKYKILISPNSLLSDQKEDMNEPGWQYITSFGNYAYVFCGASDNYFETYERREKQIETLEGIFKKKRNSLIFIALLNLALIIFFAWNIWNAERPVLRIVEGALFELYGLVFVNFYGYIIQSKKIRKVRTLIQTFQEGLPARFVGGGEYHTKHAIWRQFRHALIVGVLCVIPLSQIWLFQPVQLPMISYSEPVIRLTETERSPELLEQINSSESKVSFENTYSMRWNPFISKHYQFREHATFRKIISRGKIYSPRVSTNLYLLRYENMGRRLVDDLVDRYLRTNDGAILSEMKNSHFDYLIVNESVELKQIFGIQGDKVVQVTYYGKADMESLLDLTNDRMLNDEL